MRPCRLSSCGASSKALVPANGSPAGRQGAGSSRASTPMYAAQNNGLAGGGRLRARRCYTHFAYLRARSARRPCRWAAAQTPYRRLFKAGRGLLRLLHAPPLRDARALLPAGVGGGGCWLLLLRPGASSERRLASSGQVPGCQCRGWRSWGDSGGGLSSGLRLGTGWRLIVCRTRPIGRESVPLAQARGVCAAQEGE